MIELRTRFGLQRDTPNYHDHVINIYSGCTLQSRVETDLIVLLNVFEQSIGIGRYIGVTNHVVLDFCVSLFSIPEHYTKRVEKDFLQRGAAIPLLLIIFCVVTIVYIHQQWWRVHGGTRRVPTSIFSKYACTQ
jgi:hypothetical protein